MAIKLKRIGASSSLTLTPLIDVVFLMLIFFLVTTRFVEEEQELDLELPSASEALPLTSEPLEMIINIDREGRFFIDGKFRQLEEVESILQQAAVNNPLSQTVIIRADKQADCQHFITAVNLCKKVGIFQYTAMIDDD